MNEEEHALKLTREDGLTSLEMLIINKCQNADAWADARDFIKGRRGGEYPHDWWDKVKQTGLMDKILARWGASSQLRVVKGKAAVKALCSSPPDDAEKKKFESDDSPPEDAKIPEPLLEELLSEVEKKKAESDGSPPKGMDTDAKDWKNPGGPSPARGRDFRQPRSNLRPMGGSLGQTNLFS